MAKELKEGDRAPDFKLQTDSGETVSLKEILKTSSGKVVLFFYPKDMTSGCTQEACDFRDAHSKIKKKAAVYGISKDSIESHQKFKDKYSLPFALLSDPETKMLEKYGVWKEKSMYGRKYMGVERTTMIINSAGKIEKIYAKVKVPGHVDDVLKEL